jgi:Peptidase family M23
VRTVVVLIITLSLVTSAAATPTKRVPRLIFPVVGTTSYYDDFGEPRAGGAHQGNDILAARRAPAVAVEAGTVKFWTTSVQAGCMLYLYGDSGTTYLYIHLNNDLTGRNDNQGTCSPGTSYAPGLKDGARVAAGQLIGFVGDSGDANGSHPHLHFEVHPNDGGAVDPYSYLRKAQQLVFYAKPGAKVSLSIGGTILSAFGGALELKTSQVQMNSAKPVKISRPITLSVAADARVLVDLPGVAVGLDALLSGVYATVQTLPVRATIAAQRGDANVLTASRIMLGG